MPCVWQYSSRLQSGSYHDPSRLREGAPPPTLSAIPVIVLVVDIAVNFWRARALHRAAHETKSQALAADALYLVKNTTRDSIALAGEGIRT